MTIRITETHIEHWFGPYFWKKSHKLEQIKRVSVSKSRWYNGYGIRFVGKGWLYNVSGHDRIELHFHTGKVVYLGTDDASNLYSTLSEILDENNS